MSKYKKTKRNGHEYYYHTVKLGEKKNKKGMIVPIKKTVYAQTVKEMDEKIESTKERFNNGIVLKNQYFNLIAEEYINTFFMYDGDLSETTKGMYIREWKRYIETSDFYFLSIDQISSATIQKYYNELRKKGVTSSTIRKAHNLMQRLYVYVELQGLGRNIMSSVKVPKDKKENKEEEIVVWEKEEIKIIMDSLEHEEACFRLKFLIILLLYTGIRIAEALAVSINDFTEQGLCVRRQLINEGTYNGEKFEYGLKITDLKTPKSRRIIPINDIVKKGLEEHILWQKKDALENGYRAKLADGRLFTTNTGEYYYVRNVRRALERFYARIGVPAKSPHTYRRTFGTLICEQGGSIEVCRDLMGHESIETTSKYYVGVDQDRKQAAVDLLVGVGK